MSAERTRVVAPRLRTCLSILLGLSAAAASWLTVKPLSSVSKEEMPTSASDLPHRSPWIYGHRDARFTVIEYADLQCEYCRAYFPILRGWIDTHTDVNWQWHHLPLNAHEPAATQSARAAECAGEAGGNAAFWNAIDHLYSSQSPEHERTTARADNVSLLADCLASQRPDAIIRGQLEAASRAGIAATPTLRIVDHETGAAVILTGPAEGDTLLSAIDWLIATRGGEPGPSITMPREN